MFRNFNVEFSVALLVHSSPIEPKYFGLGYKPKPVRGLVLLKLTIVFTM